MKPSPFVTGFTLGGPPAAAAATGIVAGSAAVATAAKPGTAPQPTSSFKLHSMSARRRPSRTIRIIETCRRAQASQVTRAAKYANNRPRGVQSPRPIEAEAGHEKEAILDFGIPFAPSRPAGSRTQSWRCWPMINSCVDDFSRTIQLNRSLPRLIRIRPPLHGGEQFECRPSEFKRRLHSTNLAVAHRGCLSLPVNESVG